MTTELRKTDRRGRIVLPKDFSDQALVVERISDVELRIRKKPDLEQLLAKITPENLHGEVDSGLARGKESL